MLDFTNAKTCSVEEPRDETAKGLLDDLGGFLKEMINEVAMISDAVYRGANHQANQEPPNEPRATPPMVVIIREQRDTAKYLLQEIIKIREALW